MAPCAPGHSSTHAVPGTGPSLPKASKRCFQGRLGLGNGLGVRSKRYIALSFRTRDEQNTIFEAVPAQPPSSLMTFIDLTQAFSIFMVMGIQIGLIVRKRNAVASTPTMTMSKQIARPSDPLMSVAEHQPLLLAWALACALFAKLFTPRKFEIQSKGVATHSLRQRSDTVQVKESLRHVERQMSKMQSRVLICAEQFRTLRRSSDESRVITNEVLMQHGTALAEVQEQANSLQRVLSSLQDVVVKQIEGMQVMTPPIKRLNSRVHALEEEIRELKERHEAVADRAAEHDAFGSRNAEATWRGLTKTDLACGPGQIPAGGGTPHTNMHSVAGTSQDSYSTSSGCGNATPDRASTDDSAADASTEAGGADSQESLPASDACTMPSGVQTTAALCPEFPGGYGRIMQLSWRGTTSNEASDDKPLAATRNGISALASDREFVYLRARTGAAVGQVMQTTWQLGFGMATFQEPQWSQQEQSAMTSRLQDLCCNYDAAAVVGRRPVPRGALAAAAVTAGGDVSEVRAHAVVPRAQCVEQSGQQMGRRLPPIALAHTVIGAGLRRLEPHGHTEAALTSTVPNSREKLQAIAVAAMHGRASSDSSIWISSVTCADVKGDAVSQGESNAGVTVLAQHGLLTLLTCAVSSAMWAPPVV